MFLVKEYWINHFAVREGVIRVYRKFISLDFLPKATALKSLGREKGFFMSCG
jgi:hypothetical protein